MWWKEGFPLIEKEATDQLGNWSTRTCNDKASSIYFGIGLTGFKELSSGLPIDVLSLILTAEHARRILNWTGKIYILLADTHAIAVGRSESDVQRKTAEYEENLTTVCYNLGLRNFFTIKASELLEQSRYRSILESFSEEPTYARYQWADCAFLHTQRKVGVKISWSLGGQFKSGVRDERLFDKGFQEKCLQSSLNFLYIQSGRTFDSNSPRSAPYLTKEGQQRLLLAKESNAISFLGKLDPDHLVSMKETARYLWELTKLFELVIKPLPSSQLDERLQVILDLAYGRL